MFDIRYHIASLVAVFLALTVGILLGSVIVDKGVLVKQQTALVESLEARQNDLQERNQALAEQDELLQQYQDETLSLIDGQLEGTKVAAVITGDAAEEDQNNLMKVLDQSGAEVSLLICNNCAQQFEKSATRSKLSTFFPEQKLSKEELWSKVLEKLATEIAAPSDKAFLTELSSLGLIDTRGIDSLPADRVVFFGGTRKDKTKADKIDVLLIQHLKALNMRVVGVEESDVRTSYMDAYQKEGLTTVDNIDQVPGKVSVVYVLLGQDGRFGVKDSAEKLLPSLGKTPD